MLGPVLDRILNLQLGVPGRALVSFVQENIVVFLGIFLVYGSILFYAKCIWTEYLPNRMRRFIEASDEQDQAKLFEKWVEERKNLPRYILVPTNNEWWVKPAAKMTGEEKMLFFNSEKKKMSEKQQFATLVKEFNSTLAVKKNTI